MYKCNADFFSESDVLAASDKLMLSNIFIFTLLKI